MVKVLIKKLSSDVELPSYKTSGASGMDLMAHIKSPIIIKPKTSELIPTGLSVAFSEEYEIQIIINFVNNVYWLSHFACTVFSTGHFSNLRPNYFVGI